MAWRVMPDFMARNVFSQVIFDYAESCTAQASTDIPEDPQVAPSIIEPQPDIESDVVAILYAPSIMVLNTVVSDCFLTFPSLIL